MLSELVHKRKRGEFLVGAAIGSGAIARAAERGDADFTLVLNAGRIRIMGAPSVACMMPLQNTNDMVFNLALHEVLPLTNRPVFLGLTAMNPNDDLDGLVDSARRSGCAGIINFPTVAHFPEATRAALETAGLGFSRELDLLRRARARSLVTIAHVTTLEQARLAALSGVEIVCFVYGWNAGGATGPASRHDLIEAAAIGTELRRTVTRVAPNCMIMLEGGPIEDAADLLQVLQHSKVDGYIGGSTIDRLPVETAVTNQTLLFKDAARSLARLRSGGARLLARARKVGLAGHSKSLMTLMERAEAAARGSLPITITGEAGSGRFRVANAIGTMRQPGRSAIEHLMVSELTPVQLTRTLFGHARQGNSRELLSEDNMIVVLRDLKDLPRRLQKRLVYYFDQGIYTPVGARGRRTGKAMMVFETSDSLKSLVDEGHLMPELARHLEVNELHVPPLRARPEDLDASLELALEELGASSEQIRFSAAAMRRIRLHVWSGNLTELRLFAGRLLAQNPGGAVSEQDVITLLGHSAKGFGRSGRTEREIILDALWRHGFHRGRTAEFLNISRKTLFNKIRAYGILEP
ncbi:phosphoenolpyruvate hydrolase family protein [Labrenzia sp. 011]|uniref:phosphoenolpyruvate hydrolase family protein n=1 Tax=Labrenzia sp. 011 TaxID=2171494 RepID=UPI000D50A857|nr:phosphoenolpyruvate hydrolase family protein [Labrenzia sp. 011]PVB62415.1 hypothetical protein DCO57_06565 [Labrenzia sp. 011]